MKASLYLGFVMLLISALSLSSCQGEKPKPKNSEALFQDYLEKATIDSESVLRSTTAPADLQDAPMSAREMQMEGMSAYLQKDYKASAMFFQNALKLNEGLEQARFYLGASYIMTGENEKALHAFEKIVENPQSFFHDQSQWYVCLIYLDQNKLEECKALLEKIISNNNHYCHDLALGLIDQVEYLINSPA
jgi:tetratricopeptide (TPR) repeat protein